MNRSSMRALLIVGAVLAFLLAALTYLAHNTIQGLGGLIVVAFIIAAAVLKPWWLKALTAGAVVAVVLDVVWIASSFMFGRYTMPARSIEALFILISAVSLAPVIVALVVGYRKGISEGVVFQEGTSALPVGAADGTVVEGWYADPNGLPSERFWDGTDWSERTRPITTTSMTQRASVVAPGKLVVDQDGSPVSPSSRLVALLLNIFLGLLGIHRFYVGKVGTGVAMLLTAGGLGIWALVDFIMILAGAFRDKANRRLLNW